MEGIAIPKNNEDKSLPMFCKLSLFLTINGEDCAIIIPTLFAIWPIAVANETFSFSNHRAASWGGTIWDMIHPQAASNCPKSKRSNRQYEAESTLTQHPRQTVITPMRHKKCKPFLFNMYNNGNIKTMYAIEKIVNDQVNVDSVTLKYLKKLQKLLY